MTIIQGECDVVLRARQPDEDDYREAFVLFELEGMALNEIAEMTDTSLNTIASRVRRSRERLRALLERADEASDESQLGGQAR